MLPVTKIQKFCTHDGPGIRTTVFLKGCPLRCVWCHNPETQSSRMEYFHSPQFCLGCGACADACPQGAHRFTPAHEMDRSRCTGCMACTSVCPSGALEACAAMMSPQAILQEVMKDRAFYGERGGLTLSGGEPLLHGRAILPLLQGAKAAGITTVIETCGVFDASLLEELVPLTDLFLWDVKDTNPARHQANTGGSLQTVLVNLRRADCLGARTRLRCILLNGVNLNEPHLAALCELFHSLRHCEGIELLPYHTYGDSKNTQLGRPLAAHPEWIPTEAQLAFARGYIDRHAVLIRG
ncbi:MAG: glycyl-radical enzyme activating protein [Clostridiales bacterium]|nr:glycyl-radical enzyme activating protein [Clostridiales bacterium]